VDFRVELQKLAFLLNIISEQRVHPSRNSYLGSKFSPTLLETVCLQVPFWHIRDISLFIACSARYISAAIVCTDDDVFGIKFFILIVLFYNGTLLLIEILIVLSINVFSLHNS
jgi:hypothetical protein